MRKLLSIVLIFTFILSTVTVAFAAPIPGTDNVAYRAPQEKAIKKLVTIYVNDKPVQFEIYKIENTKYYKIRDVAKAINGTENQFNVVWNTSKKSVEILTETPYTEVGGELQVTNSPEIGQMDINKYHPLYLDGEEAFGRSIINGNGYMTLPHLSNLTGFETTWDYVNGDKITINTRPFARNEYKLSTNPPYTFSQTKMDYPYNFYIEGKGYLDFGKDKPFMENGAYYLPIEHLAYLGNWEYVWEPETGSILLGRYYTEETAYKHNLDYHIMGSDSDGAPVYYGYDLRNGNPIIKDRYYGASNEVRLKVNSSISEHKTVYKPTKWALDFTASGGIYLDTYSGKVVSINNDTVSDGSLDREYKVILKDGKPYLEKQALTDTIVLPMLIAEHEKTFYYGSGEYLKEIMQKVVNPNLIMQETFNDGKSYMETMEDLFKDIPVYVPPTN